MKWTTFSLAAVAAAALGLGACERHPASELPHPHAGPHNEENTGRHPGPEHERVEAKHEAAAEHATPAPAAETAATPVPASASPLAPEERKVLPTATPTPAAKFFPDSK